MPRPSSPDQLSSFVQQQVRSTAEVVAELRAGQNPLPRRGTVRSLLLSIVQTRDEQVARTLVPADMSPLVVPGLCFGDLPDSMTLKELRAVKRYITVPD